MPLAIYSSPLKRAAQTGSLIGEHFGLTVRFDDRLRERINWHGEAVESFEAFLADWERTTHDRDYAPPSGDSSRQTAERMLEAIDGIADAHAGAMAVVVTHGGATVDLLRTLLGDEALAASRPGLLADGVPPCALTTLGRVGTAWHVGRVTCDRHLAGPEHPVGAR